MTILIEVLNGFPQSLQANARIVFWLGHYYFLPDSDSSVTLPFVAVKSPRKDIQRGILQVVADGNIIKMIIMIKAGAMKENITIILF